MSSNCPRNLPAGLFRCPPAKITHVAPSAESGRGILQRGRGGLARPATSIRVVVGNSEEVGRQARCINRARLAVGCTQGQGTRTKKPRCGGAKSHLVLRLADAEQRQTHRQSVAHRAGDSHEKAPPKRQREGTRTATPPIPPPPIQPGPLTRRHCSCTRSASSLRNVAVSRRSSNSSCSRRACNSTRSPSDNRRAMQSAGLGSTCISRNPSKSRCRCGLRAINPDIIGSGVPIRLHEIKPRQGYRLMARSIPWASTARSPRQGERLDQPSLISASGQEREPQTQSAVLL